MRIYAVADIHGKKSNLLIVKKVISEYRPDLLVIAGDLFNFRLPKDILSLYYDLGLPIVGIRGNSDLKWHEKKIKTKSPVKLLGITPFFKDGWPFVGLNGTLVLPFASRVGLREPRYIASLADKITPKTILVTHPPPRGICDRVGDRFSAGSFGIRALIEAHPPLMVLCGHIHEQAGFEYLKDTLVVNCAMNRTHKGAIIDFVNDSPLKIKMITT